VAASRLKREHPGTQQVGVGSTVHGSLQGLEPVDLAFCLKFAPVPRDGISDSGEILSQLEDELAHAMNARTLCLTQPSIKFVRVLAGAGCRATA
jgi:hypothetical protein